MTSSEEEIRETLLKIQHTDVWSIGIIVMFCPPYLVGLCLFVLAQSVDILIIALITLGGWLATISCWMFFGKRYVMKRWYPELFEDEQKFEEKQESMKSSEEGLRRRLIDNQYRNRFALGLIVMLVLPYLVGVYLLVIATGVATVHIVTFTLGLWIATILYWIYYGDRYFMKRWYPELFEIYEKMELSKYMAKLKEEATTKK